MLFNSLDFLIFIAIFFVLYWFVFKRRKHQNILIFIASYLFYGWWDWRFLSLILVSTGVDFIIADKIKSSTKQKQRKLYLLTSVCLNLGMLMFFKYYNFFIDSWVDAWSTFNIQMHRSSLNIILPVGISFYTFQTLSYTIDVYRNKLEPTKNFVAFASFVSFFPQLVAGPIERAKNLLPQFYTERKFDYNKAVSGMQLILWGFFKKVVIADNCAIYANEVFSSPEIQSPLGLLIGIFFFTFQIYGDFSGYSDIAIGLARVFGFDLMTNFKQPYFARDIGEFWRRWHISLTTWFRDYLYFPLGGSKISKFVTIRNVFIIFLVSGFWHGANGTYIFWGFLNALFFVPLLLTGNNKNNIDEIKGKYFPNFKEFVNIIVTFTMVMFLFIVFRSATISEAFFYMQKMFAFSNSATFVGNFKLEKLTLLLIIIFILLDWNARNNEVPRIYQSKYRYFVYFITVLIILNFSMNQDAGAFIYFQF